MLKTLTVFPNTDYIYSTDGAAPSVDSFVLAYFSAGSVYGKCIDLCSGAGLISLLLLARGSRAYFHCVDIDIESVSLASVNAENNHFSSVLTAECCDIKKIRSHVQGGSFDCCVSNPPYNRHSVGDSYIHSDSECGLGELCSAASYMLKNKGRFFVSMKCERMSELLNAMHASGLEPKVLRLVAHSPGSSPSFFVCQGIKGASAGLTIMPELLLFGSDGVPSKESDIIYYGEGLKFDRNKS